MSFFLNSNSNLQQPQQTQLFNQQQPLFQGNANNNPVLQQQYLQMLIQQQQQFQQQNSNPKGNLQQSHTSLSNQGSQTVLQKGGQQPQQQQLQQQQQQQQKQKQSQQEQEGQQQQNQLGNFQLLQNQKEENDNNNNEQQLQSLQQQLQKMQNDGQNGQNGQNLQQIQQQQILQLLRQQQQQQQLLQQATNPQQLQAMQHQLLLQQYQNPQQNYNLSQLLMSQQMALSQNQQQNMNNLLQNYQRNSQQNLGSLSNLQKIDDPLYYQLNNQQFQQQQLLLNQQDQQKLQQQLQNSNQNDQKSNNKFQQQQSGQKSKSMGQVNNTFSNLDTMDIQNQRQGNGNKDSLENRLKRQQQVTEVIVQMLEYLTRNVFKKNTQDLFEYKNKVQGLSKEELLIFDLLVQKYLYSNKTKEEKIKFILRKCFKTLKGKLEQQDALSSSKEIEEQFYQKYFNQVNGLTDKEIQKLQSQGEFMPFKKDSKFKTMNSTFLKKVFNSPQFYQDYQDFLSNFDKIAEKENKIKIDKCAAAIYEMIEKREINKIKNYKRLPWAWKWIDQTKQQAQKLIGFGSENSTDSPISSLQSFDFKKGSSTPTQTSLSDKKFGSLGDLIGSKEIQQNKDKQTSQSQQILGTGHLSLQKESQSLQLVTAQNQQNEAQDMLRSNQLEGVSELQERLVLDNAQELNNNIISNSNNNISNNCIENENGNLNTSQVQQQQQQETQQLVNQNKKNDEQQVTDQNQENLQTQNKTSADFTEKIEVLDENQSLTKVNDLEGKEGEKLQKIDQKFDIIKQ